MTGKERLQRGAEAEVLHRLREAVTGQDGAGPPNPIPLIRAGDVQADPDPHGGGRTSYGLCEVTSAAVPGPNVLRRAALCD